MSELVTVKLDTILVDPARFGVRTPWYDADHVAAIAEDLMAGREIPPLRVAVAADPTAEWYRCPHYKHAQKRSQWRAEQRQAVQSKLPDPDWACWPVQPEAVLVDGFHRYAALVASGQQEAVVEWEAVPVTGVVDVVARWAAYNLRNGLRLSDQDVGVAFEMAWLGRRARETHETFEPGPGALDLDEIADRLGKSVAWCAEMQVIRQVVYRLKLDLPRTKCRLISRLEKQDWAGFVYMVQAGESVLRPYRMVDEAGLPIPFTGTKTVVEMTTRELANVVEARIRQLDHPAPEPESPPLADGPLGPDEPEAESSGQYIMQFDKPDYGAQDEAIRQVLEHADRFDPRLAYDHGMAMLPDLLLRKRAYERLAAQAASGGWELPTGD